MARDLLSAADFLHVNGIVHRDIKPENLFLKHKADGHLRLKLGDFGLAKLAAPNEWAPAGGFVGTPPYCAPELLRNQAYNLVQADLWASGCVMADVINMSRTFNGVGEYDRHGIPAPATIQERIQIILEQQQHPLHWNLERKGKLILDANRTVNPKKSEQFSGLVSTIARMLNTDQTRRYQSAREILEREFNEQQMARIETKKESFFPCFRQREQTYVDVLNEVLYGNQCEFDDLDGLTAAELAIQRKTWGRVFVALYNFTARTNDELTICKGDVLIRCEPQADGVWLKCMRKRQQEDGEGMVPLNYVKEKTG